MSTDARISMPKITVSRAVVWAFAAAALLVMATTTADDILPRVAVIAALSVSLFATRLLPEVVTLADHHAAAVIEAADMLETMGLVVEGFGAGAVVVRAVPALLGTPDVKQLVADIAEELVALGGSTSLEDWINHVLATVSCHGSVRAGRPLNASESPTQKALQPRASFARTSCAFR